MNMGFNKQDILLLCRLQSAALASGALCTGCCCNWLIQREHFDTVPPRFSPKLESRQFVLSASSPSEATARGNSLDCYVQKLARVVHSSLINGRA